MKFSALILLLLWLLPARVAAQELEYQMELGGSVGFSSYMGDVSSSPFTYPSGMMGVVARRVFNPRMVVKGNLAYANLRGNTADRSHFIPTDATSETWQGGIPTLVKFSRSVVDLGAQFEFNFWGYGTGEGYKGNSRITPYALMGMGFTLAMGDGGGTQFGLNIPIGVGVKYKLKPRVNVGAEWTFRFTTLDGLDVTADHGQLSHPYGIHSSGFKNKDAYTFLMFYITYDMCPKLRKCNN